MKDKVEITVEEGALSVKSAIVPEMTLGTKPIVTVKFDKDSKGNDDFMVSYPDGLISCHSSGLPHESWQETVWFCVRDGKEEDRPKTLEELQDRYDIILVGDNPLRTMTEYQQKVYLNGEHSKESQKADDFTEKYLKFKASL